MADTRIQLRNGTAAAWASTNPVLAQGEFGVVDDANVFKIGDGATSWNGLPSYTPTASAVDQTARDGVTAINTELGPNPSGSFTTVADRLASFATGGGGGGGAGSYKGAWTVGATYAVNDLVTVGGNMFSVLVAHTASGTAPTAATPGANYFTIATAGANGQDGAVGSPGQNGQDAAGMITTLVGQLPPAGTASGTFWVSYYQQQTATGVASSDTFTAGSAHGLTTGDPIGLVNDGPSPLLSANLTASINPTGPFYYAIVLSTTTFKVATTFANATAGTPVAVDILADGTVTFVR